MSSLEQNNTLSRRNIVGATIAIVASSSAAVAAKVPEQANPSLEFVFEAIVTIAAPTNPGSTPYGRRGRIPITGGTFSGSRIRGVVLAGGADWQLTRADGCTTLDADYMIQADDGTLIHVQNHGLVCGTPGTAEFYLRTIPQFEAPIGPHDWLNKAVFVGTVEGVPGSKVQAVRIRVFKVT